MSGENPTSNPDSSNSVNCTKYGGFENQEGGLEGDSDKVGWLVFFIIGVLYIVLTDLWFLYVRPESGRLKKRSRLLLSTSSIGSILAMVLVPLNEYFGRALVTCGEFVSLVIVCIPLVGIAQLVRLAIFFLVTRVSAKDQERIANMARTRGGSFTTTGSTDRNATALVQRFIIHQKISPKKPFIFVIMVLVTLPFIFLSCILYFTQPQHYGGCWGCNLTSEDFAVLATSALLLIAPVLYMLHRLRKTEDPLGFKNETALGYIWALVFFATSGFLFLIDPNDAHAKRDVNWGFFAIIAVFGLHFVQCPMQCIIVLIQLRSARSLSDISIGDILANAETKRMFKQHMVSEMAVESVLFLEELQHWKGSYDEMPQGYLASEAISIYNKFFSSRAPIPVNVSSSVLSKLNKVFGDDEPTSVEKNVFDSAAAEIREMLATESMTRFMKKHGDQVKNILLVEGTVSETKDGKGGGRATFVAPRRDKSRAEMGGRKKSSLGISRKKSKTTGKTSPKSSETSPRGSATSPRSSETSPTANGASSTPTQVSPKEDGNV